MRASSISAASSVSESQLAGACSSHTLPTICHATMRMSARMYSATPQSSHARCDMRATKSLSLRLLRSYGLDRRDSR